MEIRRIEIGLPGTLVDDSEVLELVRHHSSGSPEDVAQISAAIRAFFHDCGSKRRAWRDDDRSPSRILLNTARRAIEGIDSIDVVIYCSVAKYFAEPSHTSFFCKQLGIEPKLSFDVSDGCMGWITALSLLSDFSRTRCYRYGLIVSHEFPLGYGGLYPASFRIDSMEETSYKMPVLTIGEASSITVVKIGTHRTSSLRVERLEFPSGADLCSMPYHNYMDFLGSSSFIREPDRFHAFYHEMSRVGATPSLRMINRLIFEDSVNLVVHSYTKSFERLAKCLKFKARIINYFSDYGNLATSSIPINLQVAKKRREIDFSKPTFAWVASAGIKSAVMELPLGEEFKQ